jgi:hypothetical protein
VITNAAPGERGLFTITVDSVPTASGITCGTFGVNASEVNAAAQ